MKETTLVIEILKMGWKVSGGRIGCTESECTDQRAMLCPINGQTVVFCLQRRTYHELQDHSPDNNIKYITYYKPIIDIH